MPHQLFTRVALKNDFPDYGFFRGDVATIVDCHEGMNADEPGYSLELFNALGETVGVIVVKESQIFANSSANTIKICYSKVKK